MRIKRTSEYQLFKYPSVNYLSIGHQLFKQQFFSNQLLHRKLLKRKSLKHKSLKHQHGATLVEFSIVAPIVLFVGMATVQAGLIYHGKTTLNYATFEAARAGAVNNAQLSVMREELGIRLAPIQGGDGTAERALIAIAKSSVAVQNIVNTQVLVLNPTQAAFDDWGVISRESNRRVIPNSHLRHRDYTVGDSSSLNLRDANLLKIEVTHGLELKVPVVGHFLTKALLTIDPENASFYVRNRLPLTSVATVRMQSEAWEDEIQAANLTPAAEHVATDESPDEQGQITVADANEESDADEANTDHENCVADSHGLGSSPVLIDASSYESGQCSVADTGYSTPDADSSGEAADSGSVVDSEECEA